MGYNQLLEWNTENFNYIIDEKQIVPPFQNLIPTSGPKHFPLLTESDQVPDHADAFCIALFHTPEPQFRFSVSKNCEGYWIISCQILKRIDSEKQKMF